jgi:hypothetical protein
MSCALAIFFSYSGTVSYLPVLDKKSSPSRGGSCLLRVGTLVLTATATGTATATATAAARDVRASASAVAIAVAVAVAVAAA